MTERPTSAADERDEPYYIDNQCLSCGEPLILYDELHDNDDVWFDEWTCPECRDGAYMDWPDEKLDELELRMNSESIPFEEIR